MLVIYDTILIPGLPGQPSILVELTSRGTFRRFLPVPPLVLSWWPARSVAA